MQVKQSHWQSGKAIDGLGQIERAAVVEDYEQQMETAKDCHTSIFKKLVASFTDQRQAIARRKENCNLRPPSNCDKSTLPTLREQQQAPIPLSSAGIQKKKKKNGLSR